MSQKLLNQALQYATKQSMEFGSMDLYSRLMWLEEKLASHGFHPMSKWWKEVLKRFFKTGRKQLVLRVGRRGGKSSTLCRVAVVCALFAGHHIPAGDIGEFVFISNRKEEALNRLTTIMEILKAIGVGFVKSGYEIRIKGRPVKFKVYPANFRVSVGMTCIGLVCDELARWRDDDTGANPATHVLTSIKPATLTQKKALIFLSSSPWSTLDAHHDAFVEGETEFQCVASAKSWEANPSVTEEDCRRLEPDEETFQREYGAEPMRAGVSTFFDPVAIEWSVDHNLLFPRAARPGEEVTAGGDFGFTSDFSSLVICHKQGEMYRMADMLIVKPLPHQALKPSETCKAFAEVMRRHKVKGLMSDMHYRETIVEHLAPYGIGIMDAPKQPYKAYIRARAMMNQERLSIPDDKQLVRALKEVQYRPTNNGGISMLLPKKKGGGHSDHVAALVLALYQRAGAVYKEYGDVTELPGARVIDDGGAEYEEQLRRERGEDDGLYEEREWITMDS